MASADRHYEPGQFTTFAAFEWTASKNLGNLHRNVIFEHTDDLPIPLPAEDHEPEVLWSYMETHRARGLDSLAIPHNPNVSDGRMFALVDSYGEPLDAAYAKRRNWNEPLVEVTQQKGTSETHPALSMNDEFADFELFTELLISNGKQGKVQGSYVREAFINGVRLQEEEGFQSLPVRLDRRNRFPFRHLDGRRKQQHTLTRRHRPPGNRNDQTIGAQHPGRASERFRSDRRVG